MLHFDNLPPQAPTEVHFTETSARELGTDGAKDLGDLAASLLVNMMENHGAEVADKFGGAGPFTMAALTHAVSEVVANQPHNVDIGHDDNKATGADRVIKFLSGAAGYIAWGMIYAESDNEEMEVR